MSIRNDQNISPLLLTHNNYKLAIKYKLTQANITMSLNTNFYHTDHLPNTYSILKNTLPSVLKTQCFNDSDLPFDSEVKNTEIGHLFEHILLEYLCQAKVGNGYKKATFRGVTNWNWKKDEKGTFHIKVAIQPNDLIFLDYAINKTIELVNRILEDRTNKYNN
jgi:hypothetical protein